MLAKILLFLALIFVSASIQQSVFAQNETEASTTLEDCAKSEENNLDALLCEAVLELQLKMADLEAKLASEQAAKEQTVSDDKETTGDDTTEKMEDTLTDAADIIDAMVTDTPLKQLMSGIDPHEIQCREGQVLVFKASNWRPSCVNESSLEILSARGWVASHDPTHEDLTKMQDGYAMERQQEMAETMEETVEPMEETASEDMSTESEDLALEQPADEEPSSAETDDESTQGHSVNLRESMEMGAQ